MFYCFVIMSCYLSLSPPLSPFLFLSLCLINNKINTMLLFAYHIAYKSITLTVVHNHRFLVLYLFLELYPFSLCPSLQLSSYLFHCLSKHVFCIRKTISTKKNKTSFDDNYINISLLCMTP